MGLLNHLFGSEESVARAIVADEAAIDKHWKHYLGTLPKKKKIIDTLKFDDKFQKAIPELRNLLNLELSDISDEKKEESGLISDLEAIEHSEKIKRVERLSHCFGYVDSLFEYVYRLLRKLHSVLQSQMHIVQKLQKGSTHAEKLISHLKSQRELEDIIVGKLSRIDTFEEMFQALITGEHIIKRLNDREYRLLQRMDKAFSGEITRGVTDDWVRAVEDAIENKVHEAVASEKLTYHNDVLFEFVNRPEFIELVRETIRELRRRDVSDQMINVFVHLFRDWYNHG